MTTETLWESLKSFSEKPHKVRAARLAQIEDELEHWAGKDVSWDQCWHADTYSIFELAYSYPKRCHDLIKAMHLCKVGDQIVPVTVLGRALIETVAMGCFFIDSTVAHISSGDYERLTRDFLKFYAGSRLPSSMIKSVHIMDALRHLEASDETYLDSLGAKYSDLFQVAGDDAVAQIKSQVGVMKCYDELSEISHPNGLGTQFLYPVSDSFDPIKIKNLFRWLAGASIWQAHHLLKALSKLENFEDSYASTFPEPKGLGAALSRTSDEASAPSST